MKYLNYLEVAYIIDSVRQYSAKPRKYLIQVAYSVAGDKAYAREFEAFKNMDNLSQKILITNDDIDYSTSTVRHIKLKDFLLMNSLGEL